MELQSKITRSVAAFHTSHDHLVFKSFDAVNLRTLVQGVDYVRLNGSAHRGGTRSGQTFAELEKLLELRETGELSPNEYVAAKSHLLKHGTLLEGGPGPNREANPEKDAQPSWWRVASGICVLVAVGGYLAGISKNTVDTIANAGPSNSVEVADAKTQLPAPTNPAQYTVAVCKASIAAIMGRPPSIISTKPLDAGVVALSYTRPNDGSVWKYRCKLSADRVIWASNTGRWRDHPDDEIVRFGLSGNSLTISQIFGDGSSLQESYPLSDL